MNDHLTGALLSRLQVLRLYALALKQGNIERVAAVLEAAERDPLLERLLLEFHEATLAEDAAPLSPMDTERIEAALATARALNAQAVSPEVQPAPVAPFEHEGTSRERSRSVLRLAPDRTQSSDEAPLRPAPLPVRWKRAGRLMQSLVALIVVGLLTSALVGLFVTHHAPPPGVGSTSIAPSATAGEILVLGSNTLNGNSSGQILALQAKDGQPLWHYQPRSGINDLVVQDQVVYFQTEGGEVGALRLTDGTRLWVHDFGQFQGSPTSFFVDQGVVLVPDARDTYALRASDGAILWSYKHVVKILVGGGRADGFAEPIALSGGVAYVSINQPDPGSEGNWSNALRALRASDGKLLWQYSTADYPPGPAVAVGGSVYIWFQTGLTDSLVALRASDGHMLWNHVFTALQQNTVQFATSLLADGTSLYFKTDQGLVCRIHQLDGAPAWCISKPGSDRSLVVMESNVYLGIFYSAARYDLLDLKASTGTEQWAWHTQVDINEATEFFFGLNRVIYLTTPHGLYALDSVHGSLLWHKNLADSTSHEYVIAGGESAGPPVKPTATPGRPTATPGLSPSPTLVNPSATGTATR